MKNFLLALTQNNYTIFTKQKYFSQSFYKHILFMLIGVYPLYYNQNILEVTT